MPNLDLDLFLKADDVGKEATLTFLDAGDFGEIATPGPDDNIKTFDINVKLPSGEKRLWTMNKTSQRAVAQTYSQDTEKWIGKPVTVFVTEQNVGGVMKKVIYARVPVLKAPAPITQETK